MKVLITGGAGFIGSHVVEAYCARGHEVVVLDSFVTGRRENVSRGIRVVEMDIRSPCLAEFLASERFDAINHHAALIKVPESFRRPVEYAEVNVVGTLNLLQAAVESNVRTFIFISTCAVYADSGNLPFEETHPLGPSDPYGTSKLAAELYVQMYATQYPSLRCVILRYGNVYGPRQQVYGEGNLVAVCIERLHEGQQPVIFGDGSHTRDYVYVGDVADLNCHVLEQPIQGVYNVGTGQQRSVLDVYAQVARTLGAPYAPIFGPPRREQAHVALSSRRIQQAIGWLPSTTFEQGIVHTAEWYRSQLQNRDATPAEHSLEPATGADDSARLGDHSR
ncbi:MAG: NAD-dependent epimerase/dehydratase family protein [Chlorobiota bacterium]|nr:MAG: NAD-dependent epimerase/dehydratase family protein [Chlorobiota bacterium]